MAHWVAPFSVGFAPLTQLTRAYLMLVAGLTRNQQRCRQCLEVIRLLRKDAKDLPSYLPAPAESDTSNAPPQPGHESSSVTLSLEAAPSPHARAS
jgi:hypothetical protein